MNQEKNQETTATGNNLDISVGVVLATIHLVTVIAREFETSHYLETETAGKSEQDDTQHEPYAMIHT